jgi:hypothetical protein
LDVVRARTVTLPTVSDFTLLHRRGVLESLLEEELTFDATTSNGLTNHLPMALIAKSGLGASNEELRRFANAYRRRLATRAPSSTELTSTTWTSAIGVAGTYDDLCEYFMQAVDNEGPEATIRSHLDALTQGICGAAFHGALRLAYALEISSPPRIAAGLAYLAESAVPLGDQLPNATSSHTVEEVFAQLSESGDFASLSERGLISDEMHDAAAVASFRSSVAGAHLDGGAPEQLRAVAIALFATTGDFTSLHAVTGVEALTAIRPYASDVHAFDRASLTGVAAAYATVGAPVLASRDNLAQFSAEHSVATSEIATVGAMSDDEHVAKLVYSALRLHETTGDELYVAVAARKAGLVN